LPLTLKPFGNLHLKETWAYKDKEAGTHTERDKQANRDGNKERGTESPRV